MGTNERFIPAAGQASLGRGGIIASPFQFRTNGEDQLRVRAWAGQPLSLATPLGTITVAVRSQRDDGTLQLATQTLQPSVDYAPNALVLPLEAGFLQTVTVNYVNAVIVAPIGHTYVEVALLRGTSPGAQIVSGKLLGGYVAFGSGLTWPGSPIIQPRDGPGFAYASAVADGGAGLQVPFFVPIGASWKVRAVRGTLVTDATAVTRSAEIRLQRNLAKGSGGGFDTIAPAPRSQGAGATVFYSWFPGASLPPPAASNYCAGPLPPDIRLSQLDSVVTQVENMQAGDRWFNVQIEVDEWLEAYG